MPDHAAHPTLTNVAFVNTEFDGQFVRAIDTIPYGGADFAEAFITANLIGERTLAPSRRGDHPDPGRRGDSGELVIASDELVGSDPQCGRKVYRVVRTQRSMSAGSPSSGSLLGHLDRP